jgi:hypothetical protein
MDRLKSDADSAPARPPLRTLLLAAFVPFGVIGLLASPLAFNALRHLAGF